jgi:hypothetical protein
MNIEQFWSLETIGILDKPDTVDEDIAIQQFYDTIKFSEGRYHIRWPWRSLHMAD